MFDFTHTGLSNTYIILIDILIDDLSICSLPCFPHQPQSRKLQVYRYHERPHPFPSNARIIVHQKLISISQVSKTIKKNRGKENSKVEYHTLYQFQVRLEAVNTGGFHWSRVGSILREPLIFSFSTRLSRSSMTWSVSTMTQFPFYMVVRFYINETRRV